MHSKFEDKNSIGAVKTGNELGTKIKIVFLFFGIYVSLESKIDWHSDFEVHEIGSYWGDF